MNTSGIIGNYTTGYSNGTGSTYAYTTLDGQLASTTGNIYGVYDMSGGAEEYVMGNMSGSTDNYAFTRESAGDYYMFYDNYKYITKYSYGITISDYQAYNRGRLGDATSEVVVTSNNSSAAWYDDGSGFVYTSSPWFRRSNGGLFGFMNDSGGGTRYTSRAALTVFPS